MDKYIGFDIDDKKTVACVVQKGKKDKYTTFKTDIQQMKNFLKMQRQKGRNLHLTFEISGQAGYRCDQLIESVQDITVSNPSKMTWIYRTAKKNDRIDARKQAVLLSIGEVPKVHIPSREVRQWRAAIQHRRKIVNGICQVKNRIRAILKANGFTRPALKGSWWKVANRDWMCSLCSQGAISSEELGHISKQGPSVVRWLIVESAWRAIKKSPALLAFHKRVMCGQKGRKKIAAVAVACKLLSIMRAMLQTGEMFNEDLVSRECGFGGIVKVVESA